MQEPTMHRAAVSMAAVIVAAATVFCVQIRSSHGQGRGPEGVHAPCSTCPRQSAGRFPRTDSLSPTRNRTLGAASHSRCHRSARRRTFLSAKK